MNKGSPIMLRLQDTPHNGRAKDGSLSATNGLATVDRLVGRRLAWSKPVAIVPPGDGDSLCPWAADRYDLAPRRGNPRRFRRLLLLPPAAGTQDQRTGRAVVDVAPGAIGDRRPRAVRCGRLADQAVRPQGARSRHSSQPDSRPRRPEVLVWAYLGHVFPGAASPLVAHDWAAVVGADVCARQRHHQDSSQVSMGVPHQVATGGP